MLPKFKIVLVSVLAMFAFVVVTSSASAAPSWLVNGTRVAAGAKFTIALEAAIAAGSKLEFKLFGELEMTCSNIDVEAGWIEGTNKGGAGHIVFSGCKREELGPCAVSEKITTTEVRSELLPAEPTEVTFKPLNGTLFGRLTLRNNGNETCPLNGKEYPIKGLINGFIVNPTEDAASKELSFATGANELTVNEEEAKLTATVSLKLSLGFIWGVA